MDVLELVHFASLTSRGRAHRASHLHVHALASCCHQVSVLLLMTTHQIRIGSEVKLPLGVILDSCHSALTHTLGSLALGAADLLLNAVRVVMLNLLKPVVQKLTKR